MKLTDLMINQRIVVQILWGEKKIEFFSDICSKDDKGIYVTSYMYQGSALDLNIDTGSNIICTIFANNPVTNKRVSWKNVELKTQNLDGDKKYYISTSGYNTMAKADDRRKYDRLVVKKSGKVYDPGTDEFTDIIVNDICDIGISFLAPPTFKPQSYMLNLSFEDTVDNKIYSIKVDCSITRTSNRNGLVLYGCKVMGNTKDFLLYSCVLRASKKNKMN